MGVLSPVRSNREYFNILSFFAYHINKLLQFSDRDKGITAETSVGHYFRVETYIIQITFRLELSRSCQSKGSLNPRTNRARTSELSADSRASVNIHSIPQSLTCSWLPVESVS